MLHFDIEQDAPRNDAGDGDDDFSTDAHMISVHSIDNVL